MKRTGRWKLLAAVVTLSLTELAGGGQGDAVTLAIVGGRLLDGYGGPPIENSVVLVAGDRIAAVGPAHEVDMPAGVEVVDTNGMTVMPGLIDVHVHFDILGHADYNHWFGTYESRMRDVVMPTAARIMLEAGVTAVRDLGADFDNILWLREEVNSGRLPGPRVFAAGPFLRKSVTGYVSGSYQDTWVVDGADDARAKVRRLVELGVDVIKTQDEGLSFEELQAIYSEAHSLRRRVASHIYSQPGIRTALRAGMGRDDTWEHVGDGTETAYSDDIVRMVLDQRVRMAPTFIALDGFYQMTRFPELLDDPAWKRSLPADIWADVRASYKNFQRHSLYERAVAGRAARVAKLRQLYEAGAGFVLSTDSGTRGNPHHMAAWREMELLSEVGLSNREVLHAATRAAARVLGAERDLGTVAEGKLADIIAVEGDPLTHIRDMRQIRHVIKGGQVIR